MDKRKKRIVLRALIVLVVACAVWLVFDGQRRRADELAAQKQELLLKIREKEDEERRFELQKKMLESDPSYVERLGREKLGVLKEGEIVYKIERTGEEKDDE